MPKIIQLLRKLGAVADKFRVSQRVVFHEKLSRRALSGLNVFFLSTLSIWKLYILLIVKIVFLTCLGGSPLNADTQIIRTVHVWYVPFLVSVGLQYWKLTSTGGGGGGGVVLARTERKRSHSFITYWSAITVCWLTENTTTTTTTTTQFLWAIVRHFVDSPTPVVCVSELLFPSPPLPPSLDYRPDKWKNFTGKFLRAVVCWQSQIRMLFVWFDWLKSLPNKFWFP